MQRKVLTDRGAKALKPAQPAGRDTSWDAALPSFAVRVTDTGAPSYVDMRRLGRNGALLRLTVKYLGLLTTRTAPRTLEPIVF